MLALPFSLLNFQMNLSNHVLSGKKKNISMLNVYQLNISLLNLSSKNGFFILACRNVITNDEHNLFY